MDSHLRQIGMGLLGRVLDYGVARLTAPKKPPAERRLEQIGRVLHTLESVPAGGHRWTAPPAAIPENQSEALPAPGPADEPQVGDTVKVAAAEPYPTVIAVPPVQEATADEYCVGCGPNNHLAKAQSHIEEALRLSQGKEELVPDVVTPRIQDAVAELGGYEDGDIRHMREKATGALREILDDLAAQTRSLRNFLRYDRSGLELGSGSLADLENAAAWVRKLRRLGYYAVMVEVGQKAKSGDTGG